MIKQWCRLALGIGALGLVIFLVLPWLRTLPGIRPVMDVIAEEGIDANVYFYTGSEEVARAERHVRQVLQKVKHVPQSCPPQP